MNFLHIDQHIAIASDLRNIFNNFGHTINEMSLSGHTRAIGRRQANIPMLNGEEWVSTIKEKKFKEFYDKYKKVLDSYDGYIVGYPPVFAMLYKYTDKPIIVDIAIRYDYSMQNDPSFWEEFNTFLRQDRVTLVANSLFDKYYTEGFLGKEVTHIPSLCDYTGMSYNPIHKEALYYSSFDLTGTEGVIKNKNTLPRGHEWQEIGNYKCIVHFPYQVSTMSIFEQYTASIPLFFPTKRFLIQLREEGMAVLQQMSWNEVCGSESRSYINHTHKVDPNNFKDIKTFDFWLDYADYYCADMRHINYFDNMEELEEILSWPYDRFQEISSEMKKHNMYRKSQILYKWNKLLNENIIR